MRGVDKKAFGRRVEALRLKRKMSQPQLAKDVGMKQQGIDSIEKGKVSRPRLLRELVTALSTTDKWLLWAEGPEDAPQTRAPEIIEVPIISWVSAGTLADVSVDTPTNDFPTRAFADLGRGEFFALKVAGDSMDRVSPENSIIVVNRAERELFEGAFYVFSWRGEATYKRWKPEPKPGYLAPHSWNGTNEPIFVKGKRGFEVIGRVRRTVLDL